MSRVARRRFTDDFKRADVRSDRLPMIWALVCRRCRGGGTSISRSKRHSLNSRHCSERPRPEPSPNCRWQSDKPVKQRLASGSGFVPQSVVAAFHERICVGLLGAVM